MIEALVILVLLLATVYYITAPLFQERSKSEQAETQQPTDRLERIGDELADLEFEMKAGKLPREDYERRMKELETERGLLDRS